METFTIDTVKQTTPFKGQKAVDYQLDKKTHALTVQDSSTKLQTACVDTKQGTLFKKQSQQQVDK
ncbi:hypothetical protein [Lacticaseibacillus mingshuiensis]|uniref:hypothetical protein n=1 Tax=Lacticaseibacillus mingshuiensis TaxID=2799574 RepID=UPI0019500777|nr:hypothetical protein [Lacticaseibacillus mingshuiensis]